MKPELVVKKSAWKAVTFWRIILFWTIIPLIVMIFHIISLKCESIEFYNDKVIVKRGVLNKKERKTAFVGINSVSLERTLWGRIFNYGNITIDNVGKWDINTQAVKNPKAVVATLAI